MLVIFILRGIYLSRNGNLVFRVTFLGKIDIVNEKIYFCGSCRELKLMFRFGGKLGFSVDYYRGDRRFFFIYMILFRF